MQFVWSFLVLVGIFLLIALATSWPAIWTIAKGLFAGNRIRFAQKGRDGKIRIRCWQCGEEATFESETEGAVVQCSSCGEIGKTEEQIKTP